MCLIGSALMQYDMRIISDVKTGFFPKPVFASYRKASSSDETVACMPALGTPVECKTQVTLLVTLAACCQ